MLREQLIKEVESNLGAAIIASHRANMTDTELIALLKLLLEVSDD